MPRQMELGGDDSDGDDSVAALLAPLTPQADNDLRTAARYNFEQLHATLPVVQPTISNQMTLINVNDLLAEIDAMLVE